MSWLIPPPWDPTGAPWTGSIALRVPLPGTTFINAANDVEFPLPIVAGDQLTVVEEVVSVSPEKQTRLGAGHFVETLDTFRRQDGAVVARNRNTLLRFTPTPP
jgi:acyl dehydratase